MNLGAQTCRKALIGCRQAACSYDVSSIRAPHLKDVLQGHILPNLPSGTNAARAGLRRSGCLDYSWAVSFRASVTATLAFSPYPSAPICSANWDVTGAPPIITFTLSRIPA
jgi:hypothetical protein